MTERFTDLAENAIKLANQRSEIFDHDYINAEDILLGLIDEASGYGIAIVKKLCGNLATIRQELIDKMTAAANSARQPSPRAREIVELSICEGNALNDNHISTLHLLLGILREGTSLAAEILIKFNLSLDRLREEAKKMHSIPDPPAARPKETLLLRAVEPRQLPS